MAEISAGKGKSKYKIHITGKSLPKSEINRQIGLNNKVLIVTDNGIPKTYIKELRKIIKNKNVYVVTLGQGEKSKSFASYQKILNKLLEYTILSDILSFTFNIIKLRFNYSSF